MPEFIIRNEHNSNTHEFDSRAEAEEQLDQLKEIANSAGHDPDGIVLETVDATPDGGDMDVDIIDHTETAQDKREDDETPQPEPVDTHDEMDTQEALDELGESLETDPLSILPGHMIDHIQGQPAINKRGYAMIAHRYGVSVKSFIESYPWENDQNRCVARAVATTEDGKEYQDYATADEDDGDMPEQLIELASTRALKRVTGWATGLGIVSYQELSNQLEQ